MGIDHLGLEGARKGEDPGKDRKRK